MAKPKNVHRSITMMLPDSNGCVSRSTGVKVGFKSLWHLACYLTTAGLHHGAAEANRPCFLAGYGDGQVAGAEQRGLALSVAAFDLDDNLTMDSARTAFHSLPFEHFLFTTRSCDHDKLSLLVEINSPINTRQDLAAATTYLNRLIGGGIKPLNNLNHLFDVPPKGAAFHYAEGTLFDVDGISRQADIEAVFADLGTPNLPEPEQPTPTGAGAAQLAAATRLPRIDRALQSEDHMMDAMTLLSPVNPYMHPCKVHYTDAAGSLRTTSYPGVKQWNYASMPFSGFEEFVALLEAAAEGSRHVAIRGALKPSIDGNQPVLRRLYDEPGEPAAFQAAARRWVCIDIDGYPNIVNCQPRNRADIEALLYGLVADILPEAFSSAPYWYQWSNSMCLDGNGWDLLKVHLWWLLDAPVDDPVLRQWAERNGQVDECVFSAVQVHYLAAPRFVPPVRDPLIGMRCGVCASRATLIDVPFAYTMIEPQRYEALRIEEMAQTQRDWQRAGKAFTFVHPTASAPMLRLAEIGVDGRLHRPITRSAASWIVACGANPDREAWKMLVRERVAASGHPEAEHRASDRYLNEQWRSAERKYQPRNPKAAPRPLELYTNQNKF